MHNSYQRKHMITSLLWSEDFWDMQKHCYYYLKNELVPVLHYNQSSIEGLFSCIRGMEKDRTGFYPSGVL